MTAWPVLPWREFDAMAAEIHRAGADQKIVAAARRLRRACGRRLGRAPEAGGRRGVGRADPEAVIRRAARPDDVANVGGEAREDDVLQIIDIAIQQNAALLGDDAGVEVPRAIREAATVTGHCCCFSTAQVTSTMTGVRLAGMYSCSLSSRAWARMGFLSRA